MSDQSLEETPAGPSWFPDRLRFLLRGSRPHLIVLSVICIWVLLYPIYESSHFEWRVEGDSILYFAYLQSICEDGDISFADDYRELDPNIFDSYLEELPTGYVGNMFAPGAAVLWSPFYLAAKLNVAVTGVTDRGEELDQLIRAVRFGTRIYTCLALLLIFLLLRGFFGANYALLGTLAIFFCTPFYYYALFDTINAHAIGAFAIALFLWICRKTGPERSFPKWMLVGAAAGLVALCRWVDAIVLIWLAVEQIPILLDAIKRRSGILNLALKYLLSAAVFLFVLSPQFLIWLIIYGPFKTPIDFGANMVIWERPEIINILFSSRHGLFTWHPVFYLAVIGLVVFFRRDLRAALSAVLIFIAALYFNSVTGDWWGGDSFGMRRFISIMPIFALGLVSLVVALKHFFRKWPQVMPIGFVILLAWWNVDFANNYLKIKIPHDRSMQILSTPTRQMELWHERYGFPSAWPGSFINSTLTDNAPVLEADWIATTYLFYLQNSMQGEVLASYPSFRQGFSNPKKDGEHYTRILWGKSGVFFLSRIAIEAKTYMALDAMVLDDRMGADEVPVLDVVLNGQRIKPLTGPQSRTVKWAPIKIRGPEWRMGINRFEFYLYVGKKDQVRRYRQDGLDPDNDPTLRPNDDNYSVKLYRLKFSRKTKSEDLSESIIPSLKSKASPKRVKKRKQ